MPTLTGPITADGALVNVLIGASEARRQTLRLVGFALAIPHPLGTMESGGQCLFCAPHA